MHFCGEIMMVEDIKTTPLVFLLFVPLVVCSPGERKSLTEEPSVFYPFSSTTNGFSCNGTLWL